MSNKTPTAAAAVTEQQPQPTSSVATTAAASAPAAKPARKPLWERLPRDVHSGHGGMYQAATGKRTLVERTQQDGEADAAGAEDKNA